MLKNPFISVYAPHESIHVNRNVIEYLGFPNYVCLFQTPKRDKIALAACKKKHPMSFKVLKTDHGFVAYICSKKYVHDIMALNGLSDLKNYRIFGIPELNPRIVSFIIGDAYEIESDTESGVRL